MVKTKKATALDATVRTQLASLTLDVARLTKENERLTEDCKALRKTNVDLSNIIENDLKADLQVKILAKTDYKPSDLEPLTIEEMQKITETLGMAKPETGAASFKNIRAGNASERTGKLTVGSLKGLTRAEILALKGDF